VISIVLRLVVIVLLVYAGVAFWYNRMEERLRDQPHPAAEQKKDAAPARQETEAAAVGTDFSIIVTRNIFQAGEGSGHRGASSPADEDGLEQTRLRLVLLGTVIGGTDDARAIIRNEQTKQEDLYRVGSEIQGARINRISRGRVVLLVNGREEVLTIRDPGSGGQEGGADSRRAGARNMEKAPEMPERAPVVVNEAVENKVPEAKPRRRISVRDTAAPSPPPVEQPGQAPGEEGQPQPPGVGEAAPTDPGGEKPAAEPPPQGRHDAPAGASEVRTAQ